MNTIDSLLRMSSNYSKRLGILFTKRKNFILFLCLLVIFFLYSNASQTFHESSSLDYISSITSALLDNNIYNTLIPILIIITMIFSFAILYILFIFSPNVKRKSKIYVHLGVFFLLVALIFASGLTIKSNPNQSDNENVNGTQSDPGSASVIVGPPTNTAETESIDTSDSESSGAVQNSNSNSELLTLDPFFSNIIQIFLFSLILVFSFMFLIIRRNGSKFRRLKSTLVENNTEKLSPQNDQVQYQIIKNYLEISEFLENRGVSSDLSLTPKEFEADASKKFTQTDELIHRITKIYELARFGKTISLNEELLANMKSNIEKIKLIIQEGEPSN